MKIALKERKWWVSRSRRK